MEFILAKKESSGQSDQKKKRFPHLKRNIAIAIVAVLAIAAGAVGYSFATGSLAPAGAAAKYGTFEYLWESDVTDYITTYRTQMGLEDASDDEWASFLASYNLTPDRLRLSTVTELLTQKAIEKRCDELGITVSDQEIDDAVNSYKEAYAFGSDDLFESTLSSYGQTLQQFRELQRIDLLEEKLVDQEVQVDTPTDDQIAAAVKAYASYAQANDETYLEETSKGNTMSYEDMQGTTIKHSYCFSLKPDSDESSLDTLNQCNLIRKEFIESGPSVETFITVLNVYSNDDEAKESNGAMGWDVDSSEYATAYVDALDETEVGGVSDVFSVGDNMYFIYVDQGYYVPYGEEELEALDLSAMPQSLYQYFSDTVTYQLKENAKDGYLQNLVAMLPVVLYPMPEDVPYNVDMSQYLESSEEE